MHEFFLVEEKLDCQALLRKKKKKKKKKCKPIFLVDYDGWMEISFIDILKGSNFNWWGKYIVGIVILFTF